MAMSRAQALTRLAGLEAQVEKHLQKIALQPGSQAVGHWRREVAAWLGEIDRLLPHVGRQTAAAWTTKVTAWKGRVGGA